MPYGPLRIHVSKENYYLRSFIFVAIQLLFVPPPNDHGMLPVWTPCHGLASHHKIYKESCGNQCVIQDKKMSTNTMDYKRICQVWSSFWSLDLYGHLMIYMKPLLSWLQLKNKFTIEAIVFFATRFPGLWEICLKFWWGWRKFDRPVIQ